MTQGCVMTLTKCHISNIKVTYTQNRVRAKTPHCYVESWYYITQSWLREISPKSRSHFTHGKILFPDHDLSPITWIMMKLHIGVVVAGVFVPSGQIKFVDTWLGKGYNLWCFLNKFNSFYQKICVKYSFLALFHFTLQAVFPLQRLQATWDRMVFRSSCRNLSIPDFIGELGQIFVADEGSFTKMTRAFYRDFVSILDTNMDGLINEMEYIQGKRIFGHHNKSKEVENFNCYNKPNGIPLLELVETEVQFATSTQDPFGNTEDWTEKIYLNGDCYIKTQSYFSIPVQYTLYAISYIFNPSNNIILH